MISIRKRSTQKDAVSFGQTAASTVIMSLRQKRVKFSRMFALLIGYVTERGYECAIDDVKCRTGHMKHSLHYEGLAGDLILYKDGKYLTETSDYEFAGNFWEHLGGSWGGRFGDGNHFSLAHGGRK